MDVVSALVDGPRAQRAFALKAVFDGTWSITVEDRAPLIGRGHGAWSGDIHRHISRRPKSAWATWC